MGGTLAISPCPIRPTSVHRVFRYAYLRRHLPCFFAHLKPINSVSRRVMFIIRIPTPGQRAGVVAGLRASVPILVPCSHPFVPNYRVLIFTHRPRRVSLIVRVDFAFKHSRGDAIRVFPTFFYGRAAYRDGLVFLHPPLCDEGDEPIRHINRLFRVREGAHYGHFQRGNCIHLATSPSRRFSVVARVFVSILPGGVELSRASARVIYRSVGFRRDFPNSGLSLLYGTRKCRKCLCPRRP